MENNVIEWLLETSNPAVRYFTLTKYLGKTPSDIDVIEAKEGLKDDPLIREILDRQNFDGSWGEETRFYEDKYTGTVWTLLILAELGADPEDPRIKNACEFILRHSQDPESHGFSTRQSARTHSGLASFAVPCLTGNMVFTLIKLGFLQDDRVQKAIQWILTHQQADDGILSAPRDKAVERLTTCFGKHSCHMGVAKALKALAAIPEAERTPEISDKIHQLAEYFLLHHLYKKSHDLWQVCKPGWLKFGFPLMYQSDVLELLDIFAGLHLHDPRLEDAITLVENKRDSEGKWRMENTNNGKMVVQIEIKGEPSKWITVKALIALKEFRPDTRE